MPGSSPPSPPSLSGSSVPSTGASEVPPASQIALAVGDAVRLVGVPPFLKTADPMPMLRPSDLVESDEIGHVAEIRALGQFAVRFRRGVFLIRREDLSPAEAPG